MAGRHFLQIPGPTPVPDRLQRAMHRQMEDHRSSAFPAFTRSILSRLPQVVHQTHGEAFVFPATGSAMWEVALVNTVNPGARLLAPRFGQFSHLFIQTARHLGYQVDVLEEPWGEAASPERIEAALAADTAHEIQGVLLVHNETATGVTSDVAAVRAAMDRAGHPALLFVDGVSSIASLDFRFDDWRVDCAITGSQKGFMLPAGLGMLFASPKALARVEACTTPRAYFDLRAMRANNAQGYFPSTPALSLLYGLDEALTMLLEEGMDNVARRHRYLATGVRAAVKAWGLRECAQRPQIASDSLTAVLVPADKDARTVIDLAFRRYDIALGSGLSEVAGKVFRIGHLGDMNALTLAGALAGTEMALADAGFDITLGSGVGAALAQWRVPA
ncbi:aminotransferase class V-fold PLP-dependent enzyme [Gemmatimonas sp.]|jgi:alanine-glyoxylate transaminase/serine-glyoxylate transaminase/serine-pyruvate transaminase|uniref:aminotransferase class V-fold PLP-dependent enzyme n=1 Tax=Gemmatimonas sp. TaxID=1962908 RepID=UPI0022CB1892|nr:aminotransferase class V-fold PLP-dependent enzyme [Gemmatimonas sp.]MCZ8206128.1 aminotransferase class V-fold PLP-dependent enzyme [Gemmatimonas sp.]